MLSVITGHTAGTDTIPSVSHGGSSASGTRPSTATRTAQDTVTSDVTRGTGPELAQGVIQPTSRDDTGDDAAMEEETADERCAGDSNPSGPDSRRRITTEREPREARDEQSSVTGQHVPRRMSGKTTLQSHAVAVTTQEASDRSHEKTLRVANVENNSLKWVSISSAGALDMTNCDLSERRARDEMRHIIGSSEPDVIIGSNKDRNRGCKKKDKDHIEFLCQLYEAQAAQGRNFVYELTSEASMPGTRAAVVDLCMFGLPACDDGGPGFVNASVRTITNVRQVGVRVAKQMHRHTSACPGRRRRHDRKEGANGNMGASSRQSIGGTTEKKRTRRSWRCGSRGRERRMQTGYAASSMKMLRSKV